MTAGDVIELHAIVPFGMLMLIVPTSGVTHALVIFAMWLMAQFMLGTRLMDRVRSYRLNNRSIRRLVFWYVVANETVLFVIALTAFGLHLAVAHIGTGRP